MELYETEEQQIAAVKKWWKENGVSLVLGVAIGLSSIAGWKYYQTGQSNHLVEASDLYVSLVNQVAQNKDGVVLNEKTDLLASHFSDTPYAALASLVLAKYDYESGKTQAAISKLSWAVINANELETQQIAATRLIRVYLSEDMLDKAESLLNKSHPESFDVIYAELQGDFFVEKKDFENAQIAYDKAITLSGNEVSRWLYLKRHNLGI